MTLENSRFFRVFRSPDDEGKGGGADDKGAAGDDKGAAGADKGAADKGGSSDSLIDLDSKTPKAGERPEYVSKEAWDEEKKTIKPEAVMTELERANKIALDLRKKLGTGNQKAPAKPEDYKLPELKDEADKGASEILKSDAPFMGELQKIAHKNGMSQEQFGNFMTDAARILAKSAGDLEAESTKELTDDEKEEIKKGEYAKIGPNAPRLAAAVSEFVKGLVAQGQFNEKEITEIKAIASTAEGLTVLNKFRVLTGGESIPLGDTLTVDGLLSDGEIYGLMGTKAYNDSSDPGHAEMQQKVDKQLTLRGKAGRPERLQVQV